MADIVMCLYKNCSMKEKCYRYKAKPSLRMQSYGAFLECSWSSDYKNFWEIGSDKPKNPKHMINGKYI